MPPSRARLCSALSTVGAVSARTRPSAVTSFKAARQITTPAADILRAVDQIAGSTDRTQLVAGSVGEGLMTYETRSALMGYPDYTTVTVTDGAEGPLLVINARSRFGKGDMGVNRARVEDWLARLGPLVVPLS